MKQNNEERRGMPYSVEKGRSAKWESVRVKYLSLSSLSSANMDRLALVRTEGQGFKGSPAYTHNHMRFRNECLLQPPREREQGENAKTRAEQKEKRVCLLMLKYGQRYGTLNKKTLDRIRASIEIRTSRISLCAEVCEYLNRQFKNRSSTMKV